MTKDSVLDYIPANAPKSRRTKSKAKPEAASLQEFTQNPILSVFPKAPPFSDLAEESVIGGILLDNTRISDCMEILQPEDFFRPLLGEIYQIMVEKATENLGSDVVTIIEELKKREKFSSINVGEYLLKVAAEVPSSANIMYYVSLVKEHSIRREIIRTSAETIEEAYSLEGKVDDFVDRVESRVLAISDYKAKSGLVSAADLLKSSVAMINELAEKKSAITGVTSGFHDLDHMTAGFQPSDLIIIAARPSMGKTTLALNVAVNVAFDLPKKSVVIFSLEMSKEQLMMRMLCSVSMTDSAKARTGDLGSYEVNALVDAASKICDSDIYIDDSGGLTINELRAKCRRLHRSKKLDMVLVDYLQLLRSPAHSNSREQEISDISRQLKALAKELHVPVIALSQLNRSVESRENKRPMMSDLRESGAIEQDADVIMMIYRDDFYNEESEDKRIAEIIFAKQRNGPVGTVKLKFEPEYTRFCSYTTFYDDVSVG